MRLTSFFKSLIEKRDLLEEARKIHLDQYRELREEINRKKHEIAELESEISFKEKLIYGR